MLEAQVDNTRVALPPIIPLLDPEKVKQINRSRLLQAQQKKQSLLYDADKIKEYKNMQNHYNSSYWGYGIEGKLTNFDPRTPQGLAAIRSNHDYTKRKVLNFAEALLTVGIAEGAGQAARWATTPTEIGSGAEAIVSSAPVSTHVTKITTIPRSEMHLRNTVPGALKSRYVGTNNGLTTYTQPKVKILSKEQLAKATDKLEKFMQSKGWQKVTHPNLQGLGFSDGRYVVSDLGPGNVGKDLLGRLRFTDFSIETVPQFKITMQRKGGLLKNFIFKII